MRISVEQAAEAFRCDSAELRRAICDHEIALDKNDALNLLLAQALARFISDEFAQLFGGMFTPPGTDLVFAQNGLQDGAGVAPAGPTLLGSGVLGLSGTGREFYQVESVGHLEESCELGDGLTGVGILIRRTDMTERQALADAYMLGDSRTRQAARLLAADRALLKL